MLKINFCLFTTTLLVVTAVKTTGNLVVRILGTPLIASKGCQIIVKF